MRGLDDEKRTETKRQASPPPCDKKTSYEVVIVGGGISGIAAAESLRKNGKGPILVLEGSDALGGRARSYRLNEDVTIEQGANWIHGTSEENPIYRIALREGLEGFVDSETRRDGTGDHDEDSEDEPLDDVRVRDASSGNDLTDDFIETFTRFEKIVRDAEQEQKLKYVEDSADDSQDKSIREALSMQGWPSEHDQTSIEKLAEWYGIEYDYAESADNLSARHNLTGEYNWEDFGGDNFMVTDARGYGEVLVKGILGAHQEDTHTPITKQLDIRTNSVVVRIEQTQPCQNQTPTATVLVHVETGETIPTKHVIVTSSIGVLQSDLIQFTPQLSPSKIKAFHQIEMSCYMKCFLYWNDSWLPDDISAEEVSHVLLVNHPCDTKGHWPIITKIDCQREGALLLLMTMIGDQGRRIERMCGHDTNNQSQNSHHDESKAKEDAAHSKQVITEEINHVLQSSFPECHVPVPEKLFVSNWSQNPLFKGAYSILKPKCPWSIEEELARPEGGCVWFAGEACHDRYSGFVQGAFLSGAETAQKVADSL